MDVRAILMIAPPEAPTEERFAGMPLALLDIAGKSLLEHVTGRLRRFGIEDIAVVCDSSFDHSACSPQQPVRRHMVDRENLWSTCEAVFNDFAQAGAEMVLVQRLGAYVEVNYDHFLQFHLDRTAQVSLLCDESSGVDLVAICTSRRNAAAYMFRHRLSQFHQPPAQYFFTGVVNRMRDIRDFRQLTHDVLLHRTELRPAGEEIRPGIWAGHGARIERGARLVAPVFLGAHSKIRAAAVITRASSIGHHAEIDCGTIVEASSVLPYSYVGAALELANSVAGFSRLASLERNVEVEIADRKLLGLRSASASRRALETAALFARFVPIEMIRGIFAPRRQPRPADEVAGMRTLPSALQGAAEVEERRTERERLQAPSSAAFENQLIIVRRYGGDQ
jgi:NDP-sugar pyrophosphorylase family protein